MTNNKKVLRLESKRHNLNYQDIINIVDSLNNKYSFKNEDLIDLIVLLLIKNNSEVEEIIKLIDEVYLLISLDND